jgi:hypothetical protein
MSRETRSEKRSALAKWSGASQRQTCTGKWLGRVGGEVCPATGSSTTTGLRSNEEDNKRIKLKFGKD